MAAPARPGPRAAWAVVAVFVLVRVVLAATTALTPQEAYYWTWSRYPDFSYFDHPPLASYAIWLTTAVFGSTVFGVKMAAVAWSLGWNVLWLRLIEDLFGRRELTVWALLALNCTLLYEFYGIGPTPDGPLLFGWVGTIWAVWRATGSAGRRWWLLAGFFMGLSWLGKYSGVLLLPVIAAYLLLVPEHRKWLARAEPWIALALAAVVFSPVLLWNAQHEWASMAFQSSRRLHAMSGLKPRFFVLLVVTQTLLLTPWGMALAVSGLWRGARGLRAASIDRARALLWLSAIVPLVVFGAASFRTNGKLNWLIPAWWSVVVVGLHASLDRPAGRARKAGLASSAGLLVVAALLISQEDLKLPGDLNLVSGWREAGARVDELVAAQGRAGARAFVFSPNYKISSLLWFHRPSQERTYSREIWGRSALQYDYFPRERELRGATGFLVVSDQAQARVDIAEVARAFRSIARVDVIETHSRGRLVRRIEIWRCEGYAGLPSSARADDDDDPEN